MSQTLTKPILLDETGQAIAGKLDTNSAAIVSKLNDIKEAIGTSADFIPVKIQVVTPPTKTIYKVGERLNLSGMVVNLVGTNGVQIDVTSACTFSPANNAVLTASDTAVTITYLYQHDGTTFTTSQALVIRELSSIAVTTPPTKTAYQTGETLDLTGIVVTATYSDGFTANVTADCTFNPANGTVLSSSDTSVTVTYVEGSITKTTSVAIGVKELVSITVTHAPTKTSYRAGETLDLTGMVVTATYDDASTVDVTNHCAFNPVNGTTLTTSDTSVSISYTEGTITKTTSQAISVKELSSIAITTAPTTTEYVVGDTLDLTGMVVTATYSDSSTADVTSSCTFSPADGATISASDTSVTVTYTEASVTKTATQALTVGYPIYGAEWDGTATTAWTRTDNAANFTDPNPYYSGMSGTPSSPFDNIQPWAGMVRVEDNTAGSLVAIPKFYYKLSQNGSSLKVQISSHTFTGAHVSPAHMDRGDGQGERDTVYVARYVYGYATNQGTKSNTNATPTTTMQRLTFRSQIHNLGTDIWQWDFATLFTIWLLYLVEFADWDSQTKIGGGCGVSDSITQRTGYTDSMPYHTGTTQSSRSSYETGTQYRYIEGLWENVFNFVDGCRSEYYSGGLHVILNPSSFSDDTGGVAIGGRVQQYPSEVEIKDITGAFPMFYPKTLSGDGTNYIPDRVSISAYSPCLYMGGGHGTPDQYNPSKQNGLFFMWGTDTNTKGDPYGSRLMKLPSNS